MKNDKDPKPVVEPLAARLKPEEVATYVGCFAHDIPILVRAGLLKPLGKVPPTAIKYFSKRRVLELCEDDAWLARVTDALSRHWQKKNSRRRRDATEPRPSPGF
jgi:hypothetical protein